MRYKLFFKTLIFSFLLSLTTAILSGYEVGYNALLGFVAYFYFTIFWLKKLTPKCKPETLLTHLLLCQLLLHCNVIYSYFVYSLFSLPMVTLHIFGIISGYLYLRIRNSLRIIPFLLCSCFAVLMFYSGWDFWIHRLNYGTLTGKVVNYHLPAKFEAFDKNKNLISDKYFRNKIVLLDFWQTTCGLCFFKFPKLQNIYDKHNSDESIIILAVNSPIEDDRTNQAFEMIEKRKYSFPVVITKDELLFEKFGITGFPTTFVINKNGQIVYRGDIEGAIEMVSILKTQ